MSDLIEVHSALMGEILFGAAALGHSRCHAGIRSCKRSTSLSKILRNFLDSTFALFGVFLESKVDARLSVPWTNGSSGSRRLGNLFLLFLEKNLKLGMILKRMDVFESTIQGALKLLE